MGFRRRVAQLDLVPIFLLVVLVELALNRLAVPVLRPPGAQSPPTWHLYLDRIGLFVFYLASTLALGVGTSLVVEIVQRRERLPRVVRIGIGALGGAFLLLATWAILGRPPRLMGFHLETALTTLLVFLGFALTMRPIDGRGRVALFLVTLPFLVHYYGTFAMRIFLGLEAAQSSSLPDQLRQIGIYALAGAAILSPLCFAPRPLVRSLTRSAPLGVAVFVGTISALVLRQHYEVGMEIASRGLGIEIGPAAPAPTLALYVAAMTGVDLDARHHPRLRSPGATPAGHGLRARGRGRLRLRLAGPVRDRRGGRPRHRAGAGRPRRTKSDVRFRFRFRFPWRLRLRPRLPAPADRRRRLDGLHHASRHSPPRRLRR